MSNAKKYQVFARKYRPQTFYEILGQEHVVTTLKNAIKQKRLAHTYLFVGPRGTGKTSTARIFAKALNCTGGPKIDFDPNEDICLEIAQGRSLDVIEIDGASNNSVEQIRELREGIKFSPNRGQFRIYYIDEVHMLTTAAFNALLKTLEEPPAHAKFIFATTEAHKILPTILSRCQRFDLKRISEKTIAEHLEKISAEENVKISSTAALTIARAADGSMRDAQSMLDQLVSFCGTEIAESDVYEIFGITPMQVIAELCSSIIDADFPKAVEILYNQSHKGKSLVVLLSELLEYLRSVLILQTDENLAKQIGFAYEPEKILEQSQKINQEKLLRIIDILIDTSGQIKWSGNKLIVFEAAILKAIQSLQFSNISDVIAVVARGLSANLNAEENAVINKKTSVSEEVEVSNIEDKGNTAKNVSNSIKSKEEKKDNSPAKNEQNEEPKNLEPKKKITNEDKVLQAMEIFDAEIDKSG